MATVENKDQYSPQQTANTDNQIQISLIDVVIMVAAKSRQSRIPALKRSSAKNPHNSQTNSTKFESDDKIFFALDFFTTQITEHDDRAKVVKMNSAKFTKTQ